MYARDDYGLELNAEFAVDADGPYLSVFLESAGGRSSSGARARNHQYVPALTLLLRRLRDRRAVLLDALVASRHVAALPEADRTVLSGPVELASVVDIDRLRLDLTTAQGRVGLPPGAPKEGNNRKRLQLRLDVPGYGPQSADRLAADLAEPSQRLPDAGDLLRSLVGADLRTISGQANVVLSVDGDMALVGTDRSPYGRPVGVSEIQQGLDKLRAHGSVRVSVDELGHRSSFVGAVLATLPGAEFRGGPATVSLGGTFNARAESDPGFAVLDGIASVKVRREQAQLRAWLADGRAYAACALCGREYPMEFLVAAHIKKRSLCSDDERRDLRHVAMLACMFGCDSLYESGWISVDQTGILQTVPLEQTPAGWFREHLEGLAGLRCGAHNELSEPYFAWHRTTMFRYAKNSLGASSQ